ncbi:MAG: hypothetical protein AABY34_05625 [Pseudomonadota bacterium]
MLKSYIELINFYKNTDEFIAAIEYTAGRFGFRDILITRVPDKHLAANAPLFGHISLFIAK